MVSFFWFDIDLQWGKPFCTSLPKLIYVLLILIFSRILRGFVDGKDEYDYGNVMDIPFPLFLILCMAITNCKSLCQCLMNLVTPCRYFSLYQHDNDRKLKATDSTDDSHSKWLN